MNSYGKELILDLVECRLPVNRYRVKNYFEELCDHIHMERCDCHFWDYEGDVEGYLAAPDHLKGTSAIQFIMTSNITVHALDKLGLALINIFSCKDFDALQASSFSAHFFRGLVQRKRIILRG